MKISYRTIMVGVSMLMFVSLSCSLPSLIDGAVRDAVEEQVPELIEQVQETAEQFTPPDDAEEIIEEVQETAQQALTNFSGFDTSMLDSYRTTLRFSSEGLDDPDSALAQLIEIAEEVNRPESLYHSSMHASGAGVDAVEGNLDIYIQNDQTYIYDPSTSEIPCFMHTGGTDSFEDYGYFRPEDFFETTEIGDLVEKDVLINGVSTDRYSVSSTGLEMTEVESATSDIWIAQDGGYIVRYTGSAQGTVDTGEARGQAKIEWAYNLTDVNQAVTIEIPQECLNQQKVVDDVPVPDNALNKEVIAGIITFQSPDSPEQIGDFYREELPGRGWRITEDSMVASLVMMTAEKDGSTLQIMVTPGQNSGSSVLITTILLE